MTQIFNSARSIVQTVKDLFSDKMEDANTGIKHISVSPGSLGDDTVFIAICYTPKPEWANGIFENSNYVRFMISSDGTIESFVTSLYLPGRGASYETRLPVKKFRKTKAKTLQDAINKISAWSLTVETFYK